VKQALVPYAARFDALSLRERVLVALAGLAAVAFLMHLLVLAPQLSSKAAQAQRISEQRGELAALQSQLEALSGQVRDPDAAPRQRLTETRGQIAAIDAQIATIGRNLVPAQEVSRLLQNLLGHRQGLRLLSLRTLPVAGLLEQKSRPPAPASAQAPPGTPTPGASPQTGTPELPSEAGIYKHGVEITVQGSYHDLVAYLGELERLPQRLFWSRASLRADYPMSALTVTVFTLSLERTWLTL
jgi:MSHA biogenesis protein MshJ